MSDPGDFAELEFLLEHEYGRHYLDKNGKIVCNPSPDCPEYMTP